MLKLILGLPYLKNPQLKAKKVKPSKKVNLVFVVALLFSWIANLIFISKETDFALSNGSACTSQIIESSHVLKAMGFSDKECNQTIRISINKENTETQIKELVDSLKAKIKSI